MDAVVLPTVPVTAPRIRELEDNEGAYTQSNLTMLRNPTIVNVLDGCAISLPCHEPESAPVGLMLVSAHGCDWKLLSLAKSLEKHIQLQKGEAFR